MTMIYERAVVVLGGNNFQKRLERALSEYRCDSRAILVVSGHRLDSQQEYAQKEKGLESVLNEADSVNTEENAMFSLKKIKNDLPGIKRITIVSDYAHQPRAERYFKKYGRKEYKIDYAGIKTEDKMRRVAYELVGFPMTFLPYELHKKLTEKIRAFRRKESY